MRSLVTGGAGFIGSNLVDALLNLGYDSEVVCVDNESSDAHDTFYWNKDAENYAVDINNYAALEDLFKGVDYVFHIAAEARIMSCSDDPVKAVQTNTLGTAKVLQAAHRNNVKRVVYSSTSAAYGLNPSPNVETQPDDCLNAYSVSKVCGEKLCTMYTNIYNLETIVLRYFNVYGNRQPIRGDYAPVIGVFMRQQKAGEPMTIFGDGQQRRDFVNVADVVAANIIAAVTKDIDRQYFGTVFNVGTGVNYSVHDIADMVATHCGGFTPAQINFRPARSGEMRETRADISKIRRVLGWEPKIQLNKYFESL